MNARGQNTEFNLPALFGGLGIIVSVVLLAGGAFMARDVWRDQAAGNARPQRLALADLLRDGPGANRHVEVCGFRAKDDGMLSGQSVSSHELFVVLSPEDDADAARGPRRYSALVAVVHGISSRQDIVRAFREKSFTGMLEEGGQLTSEGERLLRETYPGLDLKSAAFLDVRDYRGTPQMLDRAKVAAAAGLGLFVASLGACVVLRPGKGPRTRAAAAGATGPTGA